MVCFISWIRLTFVGFFSGVEFCVRGKFLRCIATQGNA